MKPKQTKTGDLVQVNEYTDNGATYGAITIKLKTAFNQVSLAETVLLAFMQQLQPVFAVQHATGPQPVYEPLRQRLAVTDYWQDVDGIDWKVKGWTDGRRLAVLYIKNIAQVPVEKENFFLDGALFTAGGSA